MKTLLLTAFIAVASLSSCTKCIEGPVNDVCADIYDPVCVDGKTYGNECEARRTGAKNWVKGECEVK